LRDQNKNLDFESIPTSIQQRNQSLEPNLKRLKSPADVRKTITSNKLPECFRSNLRKKGGSKERSQLPLSSLLQFTNVAP